MSSIPADPSMVLGQIVDPDKLKTLQELGKILEPQQDAREKMNALMLANYNLKEIYYELVNMEMPQKSLEDMKKQMDNLKTQTGLAAVALATATIKCQTDAAKAKAGKKGESTIGVQPESPFDMNTIAIKGVPTATDSVNFDVQYFRREKTEDTSKSVSSFVAGTLGSWGAKDGGAKAAGDAGKATKTQHSLHETEGTLVIVASCTHKTMNVVTGTLDAQKTLDAWNQLYPDEYIRSDPTEMMSVAMTKPGKGKGNAKAIKVLTGATYGSTFVGLVHILERDETISGDPGKTKSKAKADPAKLQNELKEKVAQDLMMQELSGNFGVSESLNESIKSLTSTSSITAHCSLICQGIIPKLKATEHTSILKSMKPDTSDMMQKLAAVRSNAKPAGGGSGGEEGNEAKMGQQLMSLEAGSLDASLGALQNNEKKTNVMDTESLMDAFADYLNKASAPPSETAQQGCGIPINFYLKEIDKATVAKTYISQFYPDGVSDAEAVRKGKVGIKDSK